MTTQQLQIPLPKYTWLKIASLWVVSHPLFNCLTIMATSVCTRAFSRKHNGLYFPMSFLMNTTTYEVCNILNIVNQHFVSRSNLYCDHAHFIHMSPTSSTSRSNHLSPSSISNGRLKSSVTSTWCIPHAGVIHEIRCTKGLFTLSHSFRTSLSTQGLRVD